MPLAAGTRLGPYEILSPLGAGGMGEVYRARDTRLGREVALKALPARLAEDRDALARFEREARAVAALSHPNILALHDFGEQDGVTYAVMELLEGEPLRSRLAPGPLPLRKAIDWAIQIADGLAAAHEKGIVHRDLKPDNLFLTRDGRVKILDFGLAKVAAPVPAGTGETETADPGTEPGAVMGTVGYMAPEQVLGEPADHRSDVFSFGAVLYEMLSGRRAFRGSTAVETMHAILKEEPPELASSSSPIAPALERVVRRCLEKEPQARFQSARDLAFALETLSGASSSGITALAAPRWRRRAVLGTAALLAIAFVAGGLADRLTWRPAVPTPPSFRRLTFRLGSVDGARFAPDGQTIVYHASWKPPEVFVGRIGSPEWRSLGIQGRLLAVSSSGELAIASAIASSASTLLLRVPLAGGAPREIERGVLSADWSPDGKDLAVVRWVKGRSRLEFPIGKVLYDKAGWFISSPRVSPDGSLVAFFETAESGTTGALVVVDRSGNGRRLSGSWTHASGMAWSGGGAEIWLAGGKHQSHDALYAITLEGRERVIARVPGDLRLHDVAPDGRVLVVRDDSHYEIRSLASGETSERDLSWLDWSLSADLSADGKTLLFGEAGAAASGEWKAYVRRLDGSPAVQLGDGAPLALSPDGAWALVTDPSSSRLLLLPTGPGEPKPLTQPGMAYHFWGAWFPDGKRVVFSAHEEGHGSRWYVQEVEGGRPRPITPEGIFSIASAVSPDGRFVACRGVDEKPSLYPVEGGDAQPLPGASAGDFPITWSRDGRSLYVCRRTPLPAPVYRLDLATGRRELWKELAPPDRIGVSWIYRVHVTPDGKSYAYSYLRTLSELYLVEGLR